MLDPLAARRHARAARRLPRDQPLDESETASGLIVPVNEAAQCIDRDRRRGRARRDRVEPGDKVLYPRDAGYEVRLVRSSHRVRVLKREELIARIHD